MQLLSSQFNNNQPIPAKYTCAGDNISPPLEINGPPQNSDSLALIVRDPDAPSGNFVHWVVWNIDPHLKNVDEGKSPQGSNQGVNGFGKQGYGGPCPPKGVHRYIFTLYALDSVLDLPPATTAGQLEEAMKPHILATTEVTGTFSASAN